MHLNLYNYEILNFVTDDLILSEKETSKTQSHSLNAVLNTLKKYESRQVFETEFNELRARYGLIPDK